MGNARAEISCGGGGGLEEVEADGAAGWVLKEGFCDGNEMNTLVAGLIAMELILPLEYLHVEISCGGGRSGMEAMEAYGTGCCILRGDLHSDNGTDVMVSVVVLSVVMLLVMALCSKNHSMEKSANIYQSWDK